MRLLRRRPCCRPISGRVEDDGFGLNSPTFPNLVSIQMTSNNECTNTFLRRILVNSKKATSLYCLSTSRLQKYGPNVRTIDGVISLPQAPTMSSYGPTAFQIGRSVCNRMGKHSMAMLGGGSGVARKTYTLYNTRNDKKGRSELHTFGCFVSYGKLWAFSPASFLERKTHEANPTSIQRNRSG